MSDIYAKPLEIFYSELANADPFLVGTLHVQVLAKSDGTVLTPRTTAGVAEVPAGSGRYVATLTAPSSLGAYAVIWDEGEVVSGQIAIDDLIVTSSAPDPVDATPGRILTLEQYKAMRGVTDASRDAQFSAALPGAEDAVVRYAQRAFNQVPETGTRSFVYEGQSILEIDDCQSVTAIKFDGRPIDASGYILGPQGIGSVFYYVELLNYPFSTYNPFIDPFLVNTNLERPRRHRRIVEITAAYGWPSVPASVAQAVAFLVDDFAGEDRPGGQDLTAEAIVDYSRVWNQDNTNEPAILPPKVRQLLDPFRRVLL